VASAVLFALAFPPYGVKPLAWVALVPYLLALRPLGLRGRLLLGGFAGVLFAYSVGLWFAASVSSYYHQPRAVGVAVFFAVALTMVAPYYVLFAACYGPLARRFRTALPLLTACAWVAADLLRGRLFTGTPFFIGNPWALFGYSQVGNDRLVQVASLGGVYAITFALVAVNSAVAVILPMLRASPRKGLAPLVAVGVAPAALVWVYGELALRGAPAAGRAAGSQVHVVAVAQGNLPAYSRWSSDLYGRNLDTYMRLTLEALQGGRPEVVFWPESAMTFFLEEDELYRRALTRFVAGLGAELVTGGPASTGGDSPSYYNSMFLLSPRIGIRARYDKEYLVPFAEYFPLRIDPMRRSFGRIRVFTPGAPTPPLPTAAGRAGILVCNEAMLPEVAARRVAAGATYLVNPSNDTWISDPGFVAQQFDIVRLRAVEQRRYLVRASTSGPSGIVDPWGRVLVRLEPGTRAAVLGTIEESHERSPYGRAGDLFALLCLAVAVIAWLEAARSRGSAGARGDAGQVGASG
jgi:apolipoprotein N-acyltransferase